ncbi:hypothetical protein D3C71_1406570 [compost metagenome]
MMLRHAHAIEKHLGGVRRAIAHLAYLVHFDAGTQPAVLAQRHDDERLVAMRGAVRRIGQQAHPVGLGGVGDPHLGTVDHIVPAVLAGAGLERGHVRACARFRHAQANDRLARDRRRQEFAPQGIAAVAGKRRRGHVGLHDDAHAYALRGNATPGLGGGDAV